MKKETFQKKWYFKLLQVVYFGPLIAFSLFLIIVGIFEGDVEIAGFFWAGVLCLLYWLIKSYILLSIQSSNKGNLYK